MFDHYLHTVASIDNLHFLSYRDLDQYPVPVALVVVETFAGRSEALAWFNAEHVVLREAWGEMIMCAAQAARRTGDQHRAARSLFLRAAGRGRLAQYEESLAQFQACGRLSEELSSQRHWNRSASTRKCCGAARSGKRFREAGSSRRRTV
ncbi:hypothetical protein [Lentzea atacamensis]|nr:hypothetical protein [Lentzea atacamensis]